MTDKASLPTLTADPLRDRPALNAVASAPQRVDRRPADRVGNASRSADRTLLVLETLIEAESPLTLTALAQEAGIPLATCASIVQALEQRGYAARRIIGRSHFWRPTIRLYSLSTKLIRALDPGETARPHLRVLCDQLGMPAHLGVLEGGNVVYLAKAAASGFVQFDTYPGKVAPFHLTALGRAIAAFLPQTALDRLLTHPLSPGIGPKAHRNQMAWLQSELAATRERGYAVEDEEEQAGFSCIAAPVFNVDQVAYAVGITGFAHELIAERFDEAVAAVVHAARAVSAGLGSSDHSLD
jgi:IclR family KDG regulon transcriptional repressor